jgi:hypothetical protein
MRKIKMLLFEMRIPNDFVFLLEFRSLDAQCLLFSKEKYNLFVFYKNVFSNFFTFLLFDFRAQTKQLHCDIFLLYTLSLFFFFVIIILTDKATYLDIKNTNQKHHNWLHFRDKNGEKMM